MDNKNGQPSGISRQLLHLPFGDEPPRLEPRERETLRLETLDYLREYGEELIENLLIILKGERSKAPIRIVHEAIQYLRYAVPYPDNTGLSFDLTVSSLFLTIGERLKQQTPEGVCPPDVIWPLFVASQQYATLAYLSATPVSRLRFYDCAFEIPWLDTKQWAFTMNGSLTVARVIHECQESNITCLIADFASDAYNGIDLFLLGEDPYRGIALQAKTGIQEYVLSDLDDEDGLFHLRVKYFNRKYRLNYIPWTIAPGLRGGLDNHDPSNLSVPLIRDAIKWLHQSIQDPEEPRISTLVAS